MFEVQVDHILCLIHFDHHILGAFFSHIDSSNAPHVLVFALLDSHIKEKSKESNAISSFNEALSGHVKNDQFISSLRGPNG